MADYVAKIESNLKGLGTVDLGPKTLVLGPNGSRKSAATGAVELALSGRVSDVTGRESIGREGDLLALAPGREGPLFAQATLASGEVARWEATGTPEKAKKATRSGPEAAFPLREIREALSGGADKAREFFLRQTGGAITEADILLRIPANSAARYADLVGATTGTPVERLLWAEERSGAKLREARAEAKAAEAHAKNLAASAGSPPTEVEITAARAHVETLHRARATAQAAQNAGPLLAQLRALEEALPAVQEDARAAKARFELADKAFDAIPQPPPADPARAELERSFLHLSAHLAAQTAPSACPACGTPGVNPESFRTQHDLARAEFGATQALRARHQAAAIEHRQIRAARDAANASVTSITQQIRNLKSATAGLTHATTAPTLELADHTAALAAAESDLRALEAARANWSAIQNARNLAELARESADVWERFGKLLRETIELTLDATVGAFVAKVQAFLPAGDMFALRLRDGSRAVCQFGLVRDGALHTGLSGAEWARVTVALALACTPADAPAIVIPEDRAWDPATLAAVLRALSTAPAQVILATTVEPSTIPEGWTVVRMGVPALAGADVPTAQLATAPQLSGATLVFPSGGIPPSLLQ